MKSFSLTCICTVDEYDTSLLPLLRHMSNLEELTLNIENCDRTSFIDGTKINNEILLHMPRLHQFTFHISTKVQRCHLPHYPSKDDIQRTFTNIGYQQVDCIMGYQSGSVLCHVFSVPFMFDRLQYIGNTFPSVVFRYVTELSVHDIVPFKHEFFVRIARFFPLLNTLRVINFKQQPQMPKNNELYSLVEYPYLTSVSLVVCHIDYVEQFLNSTKTRLPRLNKLTIDYDHLAIVTENFRKDIRAFERFLSLFSTIVISKLIVFILKKKKRKKNPSIPMDQV